MKTTTRYEVRKMIGDSYLIIFNWLTNLFEAYEEYDRLCKSNPQNTYTIHEITTTEKDITHTAKIEKDVQ